MLKRKIINKIFTIIFIFVLCSTYANQLLADDSSNNTDDSKKCVVYRDGKLIYNPDNPKIHCTTLQILDNFWDDNNTNIPNSNKKSEDFTEILTLKDIKSNGNMVCKNPSTSNATFTTKDALEGETISGTCNVGYTGTVSATCQEDGSWSINNNCFSDCNDLENMYADSSFINTIKTISNDEFAYSKCDIGYDGYKKHKCENGKLEKIVEACNPIKEYCQKLAIPNTSIDYSDMRAIGSVATLKCETKYNVLVGNNTTTCQADGTWSEPIGGCGITIQFYSPRNNVVEEKTFKYNETFECNAKYFNNSNPEENVAKLCRIKGSTKYFGYESNTSYTINDALFEKQSSACHITYADRDLTSSLIRKNFTLNGNGALYDGTDVYTNAKNNNGIRENGGKYTLKCSGNGVGKPEIVCENGKWTWSPKAKTDNYCDSTYCDIDSISIEDKHLTSDGWRLDANLYPATQRIAPNNDWIAAYCINGYVSNRDTKNPKQINLKCENGKFKLAVDENNITLGDACVPGCIFGDTSMGWTSEMLQNTTGSYKQHDPTPDWGTVNVGTYSVRTDADKKAGALIYKKCASGYSANNSSQAYKLTYPLIQCGYDGKWSQHGGYAIKCTK